MKTNSTYRLEIEFDTPCDLDPAAAMRDWQATVLLWLSTHRNVEYGRFAGYENAKFIKFLEVKEE